MSKSNFITQEGWDALNEEMEALWAERKMVAEAVGEAAAMGDRSENAEYIYGRKKMREIDRRISYIHKRFKVLIIPRIEKTESDRAYFGSYVEFKDQTGRAMKFRLVGTDEADVKKKQLSIDSPIGRVLQDKKVGDVVEAHTPVGKKIFTIVSVSHEA
ncbi:MAG: GreA/GreB family elongation factor [Cytophagales bacterium]|nr:GreA/GreB family elongation factor [Cytophagales bacterium]